MLLYRCDGCQRLLDPEDETPYFVRVKVRAVRDEATAPIDDDRDHLQEIHESLECLVDPSANQLGNDGRLRLGFHLCGTCLEKFLVDPLGRRVVHQLDFSKN